MKEQVAHHYNTLLEKSREALREEGGSEKIHIQVGSATCEHAAGSLDVANEFRKHIKASGRSDIVIHRTGCTGRCSREPIVGVFFPGKIPVKYERVDRELVHAIFTSHIQRDEPVLENILDGPVPALVEYELFFCGSECCNVERSNHLANLFREKLQRAGLDTTRIRATQTSCIGGCRRADVGKYNHIIVRPENVLYRIESESDLDDIIETHLRQGKIVERLRSSEQSLNQEFLNLYGDVAFFNRQSRIALRNCGIIDPESIHEYVHYRGFSALAKVLEEANPDSVVDTLMASNLRGRGGAGFPTGRKWKMGREAKKTPRYIICNADEGDPGAFMDRSMLESDPYGVIEGMIIGGYTIGANEGFIYLRAEYPLAIERVQKAIDNCRAHGLLGPDVLGSGYAFDLTIRLGAGAFVCGEETALIHSIEGERGQPRVRPPYPAESGLWGSPTIINNVETFANVPVIIAYGADWFRRIGTEKSGGTKTFALAGKVQHTGLVEVPMGTTLREVIFDIGGGVPNGKQIRAVQTGGPAGGCIPARALDTPVDYDTLDKVGSIMGSGGMIVLDEDDCMVDIARYFMAFSQDESCGKCTPCREGTTRMLEILDKITSGKGVPDDLVRLERLARLVQRTSLCGLGRAAPNPVLSTMKYFREEYEAHVVDRRCPAHKCRSLICYEIDPEKCVGCTVCARECPVECISGKRREAHVIDQLRCIKCGRCFDVCRFDAVKLT